MGTSKAKAAGGAHGHAFKPQRQYEYKAMVAKQPVEAVAPAESSIIAAQTAHRVYRTSRSPSLTAQPPDTSRSHCR